MQIFRNLKPKGSFSTYCMDLHFYLKYTALRFKNSWTTKMHISLKLIIGYYSHSIAARMKKTRILAGLIIWPGGHTGENLSLYPNSKLSQYAIIGWDKTARGNWREGEEQKFPSLLPLCGDPLPLFFSHLVKVLIYNGIWIVAVGSQASMQLLALPVHPTRKRGIVDVVSLNLALTITITFIVNNMLILLSYKYWQ